MAQNKLFYIFMLPTARFLSQGLSLYAVTFPDPMSMAQTLAGIRKALKEVIKYLGSCICGPVEEIAKAGSKKEKDA